MKKLILIVLVLMTICPIFAQDIVVNGTVKRWVSQTELGLLVNPILVPWPGRAVKISIYAMPNDTLVFEEYRYTNTNGYYELQLADIPNITRLEVQHIYSWNGNVNIVTETVDSYYHYPTIDFICGSYGEPNPED